MAQSLRFDDDELKKWANVVVDAADAAPKESRKVVARGAFNIKKDARERRSGSTYLPGLARAITYETQPTPTGAWAEVGPDHEHPQGNLGHIPEYGTVKNAPEPYMRPAAEAELPRFEKAMEAIAVRPLE